MRELISTKNSALVLMEKKVLFMEQEHGGEIKVSRVINPAHEIGKAHNNFQRI